MAAGDAVAQHGLRHELTRPVGRLLRLRVRAAGGRAGEFAGLGAEGAANALDAGLRVLRLAGLEPQGFVARGYLYTRALRAQLRRRYAWWADLRGLHSDGRTLAAPALCLGTSSGVKRATSPAVIRLLARDLRPTLRLDVHPQDFDHPRHVAAIESVLEGASSRAPVTYDELARRERRLGPSSPGSGGGGTGLSVGRAGRPGAPGSALGECGSVCSQAWRGCTQPSGLPPGHCRCSPRPPPLRGGCGGLRRPAAPPSPPR